MEKKYKILALFGKAGAGKDYIQEHLINAEYGNLQLNKICSWTTRPPRSNEQDLVSYHFVSPAAFVDELAQGNFLEHTLFRGWMYGTHISSLSPDCINVGVFNPEGVISLLSNKDILVQPIYISAYDKIRLIRQLIREPSPDCSEICRRFQTDEKDFLNLPFSYKVIPNNTDEIEPILLELLDIAKKM